MTIRLAVLVSALFPIALFANESGKRIVFEKPGVFHAPSRGVESKRFAIPMPDGVHFRRRTIQLDVTHGGWHDQGEDKTNHAIVWLNRGSKWRGNVFGDVNAFGPTRPRLKMANNIKQPAGTMLSQTREWTAEPGTTYRFVYVYDAANESVGLTVSAAGTVLAQLADKPTVKRFVSTPHNDESQPIVVSACVDTFAGSDEASPA